MQFNPRLTWGEIQDTWSDLVETGQVQGGKFRGLTEDEVFEKNPDDSVFYLTTKKKETDNE